MQSTRWDSVRLGESLLGKSILGRKPLLRICVYREVIYLLFSLSWLNILFSEHLLQQWSLSFRATRIVLRCQKKVRISNRQRRIDETIYTKSWFRRITELLKCYWSVPASSAEYLKSHIRTTCERTIDLRVSLLGTTPRLQWWWNDAVGICRLLGETQWESTR